MKEQAVSIWFIIGALLGLYGLLITGAGLYQLVNPPARELILAHLHAGVWWGLLMLAMGIFYVVRFRPRKS